MRRLTALVLGAAAGGGLPQWNCRCPVCALAWEADPRVTPRSQAGMSSIVFCPSLMGDPPSASALGRRARRAGSSDRRRSRNRRGCFRTRPGCLPGTAMAGAPPTPRSCGSSTTGILRDFPPPCPHGVSVDVAGKLLGVLFLLFLIGLEFSLERLWTMRRYVLGLGSFQFFLSAAAIVAATLLIDGGFAVALDEEAKDAVLPAQFANHLGDPALPVQPNHIGAARQRRAHSATRAPMALTRWARS